MIVDVVSVSGGHHHHRGLYVRIDYPTDSFESMRRGGMTRRRDREIMKVKGTMIGSAVDSSITRVILHLALLLVIVIPLLAYLNRGHRSRRYLR
jgi:hypothetical protein